MNLTLSDGGASGSGGELFAYATLVVRIVAVNRPPEVHLAEDAAMNAVEDETTTVSHVTIVDREAWASDLSVELLVTRGVLGLASSTSLQVTTAVAEPEGHRVSIVGRLDRINALLQTLTYTSCKDCAGSATLNISVTDEAGQTGSGAIDFSIAPINDPPRFVAEWDAPSRLVMDEDGAALLLPTVET